jgi:hypothetical protein
VRQGTKDRRQGTEDGRQGTEDIRQGTEGETGNIGRKAMEGKKETAELVKVEETWSSMKKKL